VHDQLHSYDSLVSRVDRSVEQDGRLPPLLVNDQQLTLFTESGPMIEAMVADIRAAKSRVWMESYIFAGDAAGQAIADALIDRAQAGLDVRLMYDTVGSFSTPAALFQSMGDAGVKVHAFHTLGEAFWRFSLLQLFNQRNHRKLLIIDDQIGYFGGMNIVDQSQVQSAADAKRRRLPASSGWRDVHVRLEGDKQRQLAEAISELWKYSEHRRMTRGRRWPIRAMLRTPTDNIYFFDCRPMFRYRRAQRVLVPLIRRAQRSITISMAYFIPIGQVLRELIRARRRGVKIRVIIPGESDVKYVQWATRHFYSYLLARGIRIYERQDQMLHSKAMVIDDAYSVVGSCNLDPRSLRTNLEFLAVVRSRSVAAAVLGICRHEMRNSRRVTVDCCTKRTRLQTTLDRAAWAMRRLL